MFCGARRLSSAPSLIRLGQRRHLNVSVGISGGVDSAVAALLLKKQGHDVSGVHMTNWDVEEEGYNGQCSAKSDATSAKTVCRELGIPFHQVKFDRQYWTDVFQVFLQDIRNGITPNPDVMCNRSIKFSLFSDYCLKELKQDKMATGHYARLHHTADDSTDKPTLLRGVDLDRDQSYFLSRVLRSRFQNVLFPLGSLTKEKVRQIALDAGLSCALRKTSTGLCFIGERRRFKEFLRQYIEPRPNGLFLDPEGRIILDRLPEPIRHDGQELFTIGQRARISGMKEPMFVSAKNALNNSVTVVPTRAHAALFCDKLRVVDMEWLQDVPEPLSEGALSSEASVSEVSSGFHCEVSVRYGGSAVPCIVRPTPGSADTLSVHFTSFLPRAIAPGQIATFYKGSVCLGGARISCSGPSYHDRKIQLPSSEYLIE